MTSHAWHARPKAAASLGLALLLAAGTAWAGGARGALPAPADLAADGALAAARGKPVVILFSLPGCAFCDVVRQNYLTPLLRDLPVHRQPVIREVVINGAGTFTGFNKEQTSHRALARHYGARFAPTVIMVDGKGTLLAAPIVGGDTAGFYGGYLDNALSESERKLNTHPNGDNKGEKK